MNHKSTKSATYIVKHLIIHGNYVQYVLFKIELQTQKTMNFLL